MFLLNNALIFALLITGAVCGVTLVEASKRYKFKNDYDETLCIALGIFIGVFCSIYGFFRFIDFLNTVIPESVR